MQLDKELTHILVEEQKVESVALTQAVAQEASTYFVAELNGQTVDGYNIEMSRQGKTPDEAIKNLFEAMGDAGVTL